jgi:polyphosphate glucokinase
MAKKMASKPYLGVDIGGTGIKGALVDTDKGELVVERFRIDTPQPATPNAVATTVAEIVKHFKYQGTVGCTFPAVVRHGIVYSAANVDKTWIETNADKLFEETTGCSVHVMNDADAAGVAEMAFGAGKGNRGVVFMLTFGTGIGTALFTNGVLVPNTELGHLELEGKEVEPRMSEKARETLDLSWSKWSRRVSKYLNYLERLFSPDLFIIGGGLSKKSDKFFPLLEVKTPIVTAQLLNEAGIVGAAYMAKQLDEQKVEK